VRSRSSESLRDHRDGGRSAFALSTFRSDDGQVVEGVLTAKDGRWFPIIDGVPCFLEGGMGPDLREFAARHGLGLAGADGSRTGNAGQVVTRDSFSAKWQRIRRYGFSPSERQFLFEWYCKKFGLPDVDALRSFYRERGAVLEVGPGSGFNTRFIAENCRGQVYALDISEAAYATYENTHDLPNCTVVQADLMAAPFADEFFDVIVADGVLHHTPDTRAAVAALYRKLRPGGEFFFYVYKRMGAAREFVDQHIRSQFTGLSPEECYVACEALTELGRELSRSGAKVTLEKPIPVLGIPAGTFDVQRLFYYYFVKCFWNEAYDFDTNNMVNFDWYHPHFAWKHTPEEVAGWLKELGVSGYAFHDANPNGISVLLTKPRARQIERPR
jgi:SAM-dependent methyltransferase/uncharacterized protein YbaR (Trm112 family)